MILFFRRFFRIALTVCILNFVPVSSVFSDQILPDVKELIGLMLKNQQDVFQFYVELENDVFEPENLEDKQSKIVSKPEKNFLQRILYIRDDYLGVITSDTEGNLLHIYIDSNYEGGLKVNEYSPESSRKFSELDLFPNYVYWFSKFPRNYLKALDAYGIRYNQISYSYRNGKVYYQIGSEEGNSVFMDSELYRIDRLELQLGKNRLAAVSENFHPKKIKIPQRIRYYLNNHLIKDSHAKKMKFRGLASIRKEFQKIYNENFR